MAQRHEPDDSLDFFPTPAWATRALCRHVLQMVETGNLDAMTAWEPACGIGSMAEPLREYFGQTHASDVHDYSADYPGQDRVCDFLWPDSASPALRANPADWVITNPPFRLGQQFIERALSLNPRGVAMLVRTAFLESADRFALYRRNPPAVVAQFVERVPMVKGRLDRKASTATSYCWIVWRRGEADTRFRWIPPCRKQLDRDTDWPVSA
jgi:hypothetical protein